MDKVRLINRALGASRQLFPVCGISTKLYGQSYHDAAAGGCVFELAAEEYEAAKFDLVGNTSPMQQWVPSFKVESGKAEVEDESTVAIVHGSVALQPPPATSNEGPVVTVSDDSLVRNFLSKAGINTLRMMAREKGLVLKTPTREKLIDEILKAST